jgi:hypothetical protein
MSEFLPDLAQARLFFQGRKLLIATMHNKQRVLAPLLEDAFGVTCTVPENYNTDIFGTFTGDIKRSLSPLETARRKCRLAMDTYGYDLAIASEGSFGPHPNYFFIPADEETLVLIDSKHHLEITANEISTLTNFNSAVVTNEAEMESFVEQIGFPSHAIIARLHSKDFTTVYKGINEWSALRKTVAHFLSTYGSVYLESDMRAHLNPTRMDTIRKAAQKLVERIAHICPNCSTPGFVVSSVQSGLPCQLCHTPTNSVISCQYTCQHCTHAEKVMYPNGKTREDPMFCDFCNP